MVRPCLSGFHLNSLHLRRHRQLLLERFLHAQGHTHGDCGAAHSAIGKALDAPAVRDRMREVGATPTAAEKRSPSYLQNFVESAVEKWAITIKASGVELD